MYAKKDVKTFCGFIDSPKTLLARWMLGKADYVERINPAHPTVAPRDLLEMKLRKDAEDFGTLFTST